MHFTLYDRLTFSPEMAVDLEETKTQRGKIFLSFFIIYQKGDIVKQPMKKGSFVPKNVPGVGWGGVGWGGSC